MSVLVLFLSYNKIQKIIRNKDVKLNGKRIGLDTQVVEGDSIQVYFQESDFYKVEVLFEDENIVIVFKKRQIETISEKGEDLRSLISSQIGVECYAVHRLDRNTEGLVIFAKNLDAKKQLDIAFKNRTIDKFYFALVYGCFEKKKDEMVAYLKKDKTKSLVSISDIPADGFEKIQTNYEVLKEYDDASLLRVELVTGKTHQIRAHFSHIGHALIGDEKYGDSKINKIFKKKYQSLCACKIKFNLMSGCLKYLNGREFEVLPNQVDFYK